MLSTHQIAIDLETLLNIQIGSYDNLPPHGSPDNKQILLSTLVGDLKLIKNKHNLTTLRQLEFSIVEYQNACRAEMPIVDGKRQKIEAYGILVINSTINLLNQLDKQRTKENKILSKMALKSDAMKNKDAESKLNDNALLNNTSATTIPTAKPRDEKEDNGDDSSNPVERATIQPTPQPPLLKPISNASFTTLFGISSLDSDSFSLDDQEGAEENAMLSIVITSSDGVSSNHQLR